MRQFIVRFLVGLIMFTGLLPMTPHDDFGNSAHAHEIAATDSVSAASTDDSSKDQDGSPVVHCYGAAHVFVLAALSSTSRLQCGSVMNFALVDIPASRNIPPLSPPPNLQA